MNHLRSRGVICSIPFDQNVIRGIDLHSHKIRVFHWVKGDTLRNIHDFHRKSVSFNRNIGVFIGNISSILQNFYHEGFHSYKNNEWNLMNAASIISASIENVKDDIIKKNIYLIRIIMNKLNEQEEKHQHLPCQVCHSDANENNIIYDSDRDIFGVIDFGDSCWTYRVAEIVIAMTHIIYLCFKETSCIENAIRAGNIVLNGYQSIILLSDEEVECIPLLIQMRLLICLLNGIEHIKRDPKNKDYILEMQEFGWILLRNLVNIHFGGCV